MIFPYQFDYQELLQLKKLYNNFSFYKKQNLFKYIKTNDVQKDQKYCLINSSDSIFSPFFIDLYFLYKDKLNNNICLNNKGKNLKSSISPNIIVKSDLFEQRINKNNEV